MILSRNVEIRFVNNDYSTIKGSNIIAESMTITRSICDGNLKLGGCIASQFEIQLIGIPPDKLNNKRIQVVLLSENETDRVIHPSTDLIPSINIYPNKKITEIIETILFTGTIDTAVREKNRQIITVTAFDDLYTICRKNVYTWFYNWANYSGTAYIQTMLDSLFSSQVSEMQYVLRWATSGENNNHTKPLSLSPQLVKQLYNNGITALDILKSANELMGLFGYITPDGRYTVKSVLNQDTIQINSWIDLEFSEYETAIIDIVRFNYDNDNVYTIGRSSEKHSCYYNDDNILTNCSTDRNTIATLIKNVATGGKLSYSDYKYRPFLLTTISNLLVNLDLLGCKLRIATGESDLTYINSYVFNQKITGIQNPKIELSAVGDEILQGYDQQAENEVI